MFRIEYSVMSELYYDLPACLASPHPDLPSIEREGSNKPPPTSFTKLELTNLTESIVILIS